MKLTNLKPRLKVAPSRLKVMAPFQAVAVRKRGSAGVKDRENIKRRDHGICQACWAAGRTAVGTVVDHRKPLWDGGSDEDSNKWLLCNECHDIKTRSEATDRANR
jgi:5-methylcytosine-specific restriction protein A